jgi:membrane protease YdiL (CAAX protease family)
MFARSGPPWGWRNVAVGVGVGLGLFFATSIAVAVVIAILGYEPVTSDAGDTFEIAGRIAEYTDKRLQAAAAGIGLPDPPLLKADIGTLRVAFAVTLVYQLVAIAAVPLIARRSPAQLAADFRLDQMDATTFWLPFVVMLGCYLGVALYAVVLDAIGPDILVPESTVPDAIARDRLALGLAGLAAVGLAPVAEELFYRGLVMGGLLRMGFWPAAAISSLLFSATHLDPGSLLPFFAVGMALAWLAWRRGSLWDSIVCHFFFNTTSFLLLVLLEA